MTMEDIQAENRAGRGGALLTCVIVDEDEGRSYHEERPDWIDLTPAIGAALSKESASIPYGLPNEPISSARPSPNARGLSGLTRHGLDRFELLFNPRQLLALTTLLKATHASRTALGECGYTQDWMEPITAFLALAIDRVSDRNSMICH